MGDARASTARRDMSASELNTGGLCVRSVIVTGQVGPVSVFSDWVGQQDLLWPEASVTERQHNDIGCLGKSIFQVHFIIIIIIIVSVFLERLSL